MIFGVPWFFLVVVVAALVVDVVEVVDDLETSGFLLELLVFPDVFSVLAVDALVVLCSVVTVVDSVEALSVVEELFVVVLEGS